MEKPRISYTEFAAQMKYETGSVADYLERRCKDSKKPGARPLGKSTVFALRAIQRTEFAKLQAATLKPADLIEFGRMRRASGVKPATVNQDISIIRGTLWRFVELDELDEKVMLVFKKVNKRMQREQLIGKAEARDRLPVQAELDACRAIFEEANKLERTEIDMVIAQDFLLASGRRISEMCRIERQHVNVEKKTCMLYNLKNAAGKGKHGEFALLGRAWEIVQERLAVIGQEPTARLFPWNPQSVSQRGTLARRKANISGLHTHDLRAACFTDLLKRGYSVIQVQKGISLHEGDAKTLVKHYSRLTAADLHAGPAGA